MSMIHFPIPSRVLMLSAVLVVSINGLSAAEPAIKEGAKAKDFELEAIAGELSGKVKLSEVTQSGPTVLVVLRGFPGYQCPICSRQVGELRSKAAEFKKHKAKVLLVYPGPAAKLADRAEEFLKGTKLPAPLTLLVDPDYAFTNAYGLRWNAVRETAYPSTFVIDSSGKVTYAKISESHGGRSRAGEVLSAVSKIAK